MPQIGINQALVGNFPHNALDKLHGQSDLGKLSTERILKLLCAEIEVALKLVHSFASEGLSAKFANTWFLVESHTFLHPV